GDIMTITNYVCGPDVALGDQIAGVFVGRAAVNAFWLLEPKPESPFDNIVTTFKMGSEIWFTQSGLSGNQGGSGGTGGSSGGTQGGSSGGTGGGSGGTQGGGSAGGTQGSYGDTPGASAGVLVVDLDGTGIRLTAETGVAPMFDMF